MKVLNVVGARPNFPNFMKIAPIVEEMKKAPDLTGVLVHTGQHYDDGMSDVFFRELGIPVPDVYLGVGSGSPRRISPHHGRRLETGRTSRVLGRPRRRAHYPRNPR